MTDAFKPLPCDNDAENAVLGAMLQWREIVPTVLRVIPEHMAEVFNDKTHQAVFGLIVDMWTRNETVDLISFKYRALECGILKPEDAERYIVNLVESVTGPVHAEYHARIVREMAWRRGAIAAAKRIEDAAYTGDGQEPGSTRESIERVACKLLEREQEQAAAQTMGEMVAEALADIEARRGKGMDGLPTGFRGLDDLLCGMHRQEMILLAARPSQGKTALGMKLAVNAAAHGGVAFMSLEMGRNAIMQRLLCSEASVDSQHLRNGMVTDAEMERLRIAGRNMDALPLIICDKKGVTMADVRSLSRLWRDKHGMELLVIDYLQLMRTFGRVESRQQEVAGYSAGLKALAGELNIPVVVLCQLNRNPEGRTDFRPRPSDLRESGTLEQDADVVMLLHRPEMYFRPGSSLDAACPCGCKEQTHYRDCCRGKAEVIVAKNRNGPVGVAHLHFEAQYTRFSDAASGVQEPDYVPHWEEPQEVGCGF